MRSDSESETKLSSSKWQIRHDWQRNTIFQEIKKRIAEKLFFKKMQKNTIFQEIEKRIAEKLFFKKNAEKYNFPRIKKH